MKRTLRSRLVLIHDRVWRETTLYNEGGHLIACQYRAGPSDDPAEVVSDAADFMGGNPSPLSVSYARRWAGPINRYVTLTTTKRDRLDEYRAHRAADVAAAQPRAGRDAGVRLGEETLASVFPGAGGSVPDERGAE